MRESLMASRINLSRQDVKQWFSDVRSYLAENNLLDILNEAKRNFNIDELGFGVSQLVPKNECFPPVCNENEQITVLANIGADGSLPPPLIIYPNLRIPIAVYDSLPSKIAAIGKSESGQINNEVLYEYLCDDFDKWLTYNNIQRPVILWADRHESRLHFNLEKKLEELQIILILIPPNIARFVQPIEAGMFADIKKAWQKCVIDFRASYPNEYVITDNFAHIFLPMYKSVMSKDKIKNAFRKCGLHSYDDEAPDYSNLTKVTKNSIKFTIFGKMRQNGMVERGTQITPVLKLDVETQTQSTQPSETNNYSLKELAMIGLGAQRQIISKGYDDAVMCNPRFAALLFTKRKEWFQFMFVVPVYFNLNRSSTGFTKFSNPTIDPMAKIVKEPIYLNRKVDPLMSSEPNLKSVPASESTMNVKLKTNSTKIIFMKDKYPFLKEGFVSVQQLPRELTVTDVPKYASADNIKIEIDMDPSSYSSKTQCNEKMEGGSEDEIADNEIPDQKDDIMNNELLDLAWIKIENGMEFKEEPIDLNCTGDPSSYSSKNQCNEKIRPNADLKDEIVDKELFDPSSKIVDNELPDQEDEIVDVELLDPSPERNIDLPDLVDEIFDKELINPSLKIADSEVPDQEDEIVDVELLDSPPERNIDLSDLEDEIIDVERVDKELINPSPKIADNKLPDQEDEIVDVELLDSSPERNIDLLDLEDKIIDVKTLDRSPELCEDDVPLSVLFNKNTFSIQEDSANGCCTKLDPPVNLMKNDSILKKLLVMEGETISSEPNLEEGLELNDTCENQPRIRSDCQFAPFDVRPVVEGNLFPEHIFLNAPNSKTYKCTLCDASFARNYSLKKHKQSVHERARPFKCPSCDYASSRKDSLSDHIRAVHEKLRPFKCPSCDYNSSRRETLSKHIRVVHEKLKQFKCLCCDYSCSKKSSLLKHEMLIHKKLKRIFKCFSCNYTSNKKIDLLRHIQSSHNKILVEKAQSVKMFIQSWPNEGLISRLNQESQTDRGLFGENKDSEPLASTRTKQELKLNETKIPSSRKSNCTFPRADVSSVGKSCRFPEHTVPDSQNLKANDNTLYEALFSGKKKIKVHILSVHENVNNHKYFKSNHKMDDKKQESSEKWEQERILELELEPTVKLELEPTEEWEQELTVEDDKLIEKDDLESIEEGKQEPTEEFMTPWTDKDPVMSELIQELNIEDEFFGEKLYAELLASTKSNQDPNLTKFYRCPKPSCYESFSSIESCDDHVKLHKQFICSFCDKAYLTKITLIAHLSSVHGKMPSPKYHKCPYCFYASIYRKSLTLHIRTVHKDSRSFKCISCDYTSRRKRQLSFHIKTVHKETFNCEFCDFSCKQKSRLNRHTYLVHKNIKPYKCLSRDYACGQPSMLTRHAKSVHKKLKQFKCLCCDYSCSKKSSLLTHEMLVHKKLKRTFKCSACNYTRSKKIDLLRHIQSIHNKILVEKAQPVKMFIKSWPNEGLMSCLNQETKTDRQLFGENKDSEPLASTMTKQEFKLNETDEFDTAMKIQSSRKSNCTFPHANVSSVGESCMFPEHTVPDSQNLKAYDNTMNDASFPEKKNLKVRILSVHENVNNHKYPKSNYNIDDKKQESSEEWAQERILELELEPTVKLELEPTEEWELEPTEEWEQELTVEEDKKLIEKDDLESIEEGKQEPTEEFMTPWTDKDPLMSELIHELKTEDEFFGDKLYAELLASSKLNQVQIQSIECQEESSEVELRKHHLEGSELTLQMDPNLTKFYRCPKPSCYESFSSIESCDDHVKLHKQFICSFCDKAYLTKITLIAHLSSGHGKQPSLKYHECPYCFYASIYTKSLTLHIRTVHKDLMPFKCISCDYTSRRKRQLSFHIKTVHKKTLNCEYCDFSCKQKWRLNRHTYLVHKNIKPYKCPSCDYSCGQPSMLAWHAKSVHRKLKRFKCYTCTYICFAKEDLNRHIYASHKIRMSIRNQLKRKTLKN